MNTSTDKPKKTQRPKRYRSRGAGTLVKEKSGLFIAKWTYQGKIMTRSTKCYEQDKNGREEALKKLDEFVRPYLESSKIAVLENLAARVRTIQAGGNTLEAVEAEQRRIKLVDMLDAFFDNVNTERIEESTKGIYHATVNRLLRWMDEHYKRVVFMDEVTYPMASEFLSETFKELSVNTYNSRLGQLTHIYDILLSKDNVWSKFRRHKSETRFPRRALTREELKRLLEYSQGLPFDRRMLVYIGIYTGMRLSDCCLLEWKDIHFDKGYITRLPLKTKRHNRPLFVPIHPTLRKVLEEAWSRHSHHEGYVSDWNAAAYLKNHIGECVADIFVQCKIKTANGDYFGFHLLRHTFVSICANSGVPLAVVKNIIGHSSEDITRHYFHLDQSVCMDAIMKLCVNA